MTRFEDYKDRFEHFVRLERSDGVLTATLHSGGGPWIFDQRCQDDIAPLFRSIADDRDNQIVIFTGTGDGFCPGIDTDDLGPTLAAFDTGWFERWNVNGRRGLQAMLDIEAPVILALNGPTSIHAELWMPADIKLATPDASIQDLVYLGGGNTPAVNPVAIWETLLGHARAKNFHFGQQTLSAQHLLDIGVYTEIVERGDLLARAHAHAERLLKLPEYTRRYARFTLNHRLRRAVIEDSLGYGFLGVQLLDTLVIQGRPAA